MEKTKTKELELYRMSDGFWAGHRTKDKKRMRAGSHKITGEEIMTMFTEFFQDYCKESGGDKLIMQDGDGRLFVTMRAGQPAKDSTEPPGGRKKKRK